MILPCPTRNQQGPGFRARRQPASGQQYSQETPLSRFLSAATDFLLELLMDRVQSVFDGDAFQVSGSHFQSERKVKVDLLDRRGSQHLFEGIPVVDR